MLPFNQRKYILLDLDGTVIDSQEGIFNGLYFMFDRAGMERPSPAELRGFIGPAIGTILRERYAFPPADIDRLVGYYREYYAEKGLCECAAYSGVEALLRHLRRQEKKTAIATKKPEPFARQIMCNLHLAPLLDAVCGADPADRSDHKDTVILQALADLGCTDKGEALMVGDTRFDCIGARLAGVDCVGVDYGFGGKEELLQHGALAVAGSMAELETLLCDQINDTKCNL